MCLLTVCKPNSIPTREELIQGSGTNPHGFGFAIIINGELIIKKSMESADLIDEFLALRAENMGGYCIFHSRYASYGEISLDNCHPFYLGEDKMTILAHNGNLCNDLQDKDDTRSDSRWFAETVMPSLGGIASLDNPYFCEMLQKWSGSNRIAFLTVNPEAEYELYLFGEEYGETDKDGIYWSNTYHRREANGLIQENDDDTSLDAVLADLEDSLSAS